MVFSPRLASHKEPSSQGKGKQETVCGTFLEEEGSDPVDVPTAAPSGMIQPQEAMDNKSRKSSYNYK